MNFEFTVEEWSTLCSLPAEDVVRLATHLNYAPPEEIDRRRLLEECMRMPATIASSVMFDQTMQDYRTRVSAVNVPTLVMTGGCEGKLLPVESVKFVHDNISGSQFSVYENSNHCPFLEETDRFNQEVEAFVSALG